MSGNFKALGKEQKDTAKISKDNLKYLVYLDRNERRKNVKFLSAQPASMSLKAGKELKNLQNENIYVKPDISQKKNKRNSDLLVTGKLLNMIMTRKESS